MSSEVRTRLSIVALLSALFFGVHQTLGTQAESINLSLPLITISQIGIKFVVILFFGYVITVGIEYSPHLELPRILKYGKRLYGWGIMISTLAFLFTITLSMELWILIKYLGIKNPSETTSLIVILLPFIPVLIVSLFTEKRLLPGQSKVD